MPNEETPSKRGNPRKQPASGDRSSTTGSPSYECLNVFEIHSVRWEDDDHQSGKDWRTIIVCKDIEAVWKWLESDRNDLRTEVRTIHMLGHCCQVIPFIPENSHDQASGIP